MFPVQLTEMCPALNIHVTSRLAYFQRQTLYGSLIIHVHESVCERSVYTEHMLEAMM